METMEEKGLLLAICYTCIKVGEKLSWERARSRLEEGLHARASRRKSCVRTPWDGRLGQWSFIQEPITCLSKCMVERRSSREEKGSAAHTRTYTHFSYATWHSFTHVRAWGIFEFDKRPYSHKICWRKTWNGGQKGKWASFLEEGGTPHAIGCFRVSNSIKWWARERAHRATCHLAFMYELGLCKKLLSVYKREGAEKPRTFGYFVHCSW